MGMADRRSSRLARAHRRAYPLRLCRVLQRLPHCSSDCVDGRAYRRTHRRAARRGPGATMNATTPAASAPPLDAELERLLKRMRLPYIRRAAPELLATAK